MARRAALALGLLLAGAPAGAEPADQVLPYGEVSWSRGYVRVSAVGLPALDGGGGEVARRNAVSAAQKRLLGVVLDMTGSHGKLRDQVGRRPELKNRLRALVDGADVRGKTFADGSVEITLTVHADSVKALLRDF